ncbi:hypothetical protein RF11_14124 [Thelohanellus kitauei]|uniref:Uncharacterized protein n=1 Tax=Thelohanellus kitauei TaxID=669202 RepID=A0A0C2N443_THEKT|nr:hypothetical protein RF11_14124 [Thelohanellus kitauei]
MSTCSYRRNTSAGSYRLYYVEKNGYGTQGGFCITHIMELINTRNMLKRNEITKWRDGTDVIRLLIFRDGQTVFLGIDVKVMVGEAETFELVEKTLDYEDFLFERLYKKSYTTSTFNHSTVSRSIPQISETLLESSTTMPPLIYSKFSQNVYDAAALHQDTSEFFAIVALVVHVFILKLKIGISLNTLDSPLRFPKQYNLYFQHFTGCYRRYSALYI